MESTVLIALLVAALAFVLFLAVKLAQKRAHDDSGPADRRQYIRVPCYFRSEGSEGNPMWTGNLSLGGACVRMPTATLEDRLKVVAVDSHGLAAAATVEGKVVSMQRDGQHFVHHVAFDESSNLTVAALVAASAWPERVL